MGHKWKKETGEEQTTSGITTCHCNSAEASDVSTFPAVNSPLHHSVYLTACPPLALGTVKYCETNLLLMPPSTPMCQTQRCYSTKLTIQNSTKFLIEPLYARNMFGGKWTGENQVLEEAGNFTYWKLSKANIPRTYRESRRAYVDESKRRANDQTIR
ncbi:hypothetical protein CBL_14449 [Carabus blaptoides fortunei]